MKEVEYRPISDDEAKLIEKLLQIKVSGSEHLRSQINGMKVKLVDDNGSISLQALSTVRAPVEDGPISEARYADLDTNESKRAHVNVLLHVREGRLWMLEIFKDDSTPVLKAPHPEELLPFSRFE